MAGQAKKKMEEKNHIHSFVFLKKKKNGEELYKCADPSCLYVIGRDLIEGKISLCPKCFKNTLLLDKEAMRRKRPVCIDCANTKRAVNHRRAKDIIGSIFDDSHIEKTLINLKSPTSLFDIPDEVMEDGEEDETTDI